MKKIALFVTGTLSLLLLFFLFRTQSVQGAPPSSELQKYIFELPRVTTVTGNDDIVTKIRSQVSLLVASNNHELRGVRNWGTATQLLWGHGKAVASIAQTLPYLESSQSQSVRQYLDVEVNTYLLSQSHITNNEVSGTVGKAGTDPTYGVSWSGNSAFCWDALYGLWAYAHYTNNWAPIQSNWNTIKSIFTSCGQNSSRFLGNSSERTSGINSEIAGNIAMARMAQIQADTTTKNTAATRATTLLSTKIDQISAQSNNPVILKGGSSLARFLIIDGYQDLTPDLARVLRDYSKTKVTAQMNTVTNRFRTWYLSDMDHVSDWMAVAPFPPITDAGERSGEEGYQMNLFASPIFLLRAYTTEESVATLRKELPLAMSSRSVPGYLDILRLQHLVALMHRANGLTWSQ